MVHLVLGMLRAAARRARHQRDARLDPVVPRGRDAVALSRAGRGARRRRSPTPSGMLAAGRLLARRRNRARAAARDADDDAPRPRRAAARPTRSGRSASSARRASTSCPGSTSRSSCRSRARLVSRCYSICSAPDERAAPRDLRPAAGPRLGGAARKRPLGRRDRRAQARRQVRLPGRQPAADRPPRRRRRHHAAPRDAPARGRGGPGPRGHAAPVGPHGRADPVQGRARGAGPPARAARRRDGDARRRRAARALRAAGPRLRQARDPRSGLLRLLHVRPGRDDRRLQDGPPGARRPARPGARRGVRGGQARPRSTRRGRAVHARADRERKVRHGPGRARRCSTRPKPAGVDIPSSCRAGVCQTCRTKVVSGDVDCPADCLDDADRREGWVYPCVAWPRSNCALEA